MQLKERRLVLIENICVFSCCNEFFLFGKFSINLAGARRYLFCTNRDFDSIFRIDTFFALTFSNNEVEMMKQITLTVPFCAQIF